MILVPGRRRREAKSQLDLDHFAGTPNRVGSDVVVDVRAVAGSNAICVSLSSTSAPSWIVNVNSQGQYAASELAFALESVGRLSEAIDVLEYVGADRVGVVIENTLGRWLRGRAQLARLYRKNGQDEKARGLEAHLLKLLAVADAGHPLVRELRARSTPK